MKKASLKKEEIELDEYLGNLEFPADSASIIFAMFDNFRNESIHIVIGLDLLDLLSLI